MKKLALFLLASISAYAQWASPGIGFDFRNSSGFVTDPTSTQFVGGFALSPYPTTSTIGGVSVTYGWLTASGSGAACASTSNASAADRNAALDARLAGVNYTSSGLCAVFRVDLPSTGSYDISVALGDDSQAEVVWGAIYDNTTLGFQVATNANTGGADEWYDATGVLRTSAANWVANQAPKTLTFATTTFMFQIGQTTSTGFSTLSHIRIKQHSSSVTLSGPATVKQGATATYTASGGTAPYTFSLVGASSGSIVGATGVYTAPATVTPSVNVDGCQILPNNHIFNQDLTAMPVDTRTNGAGTNNSVWFASWTGVEGANPHVQHEFSWTPNYVKSTDPTTNMNFYYGPGNPGNGLSPTGPYIIPSFPNLRAENGLFALPGGGFYNGTDHHNLMMTTDTCQMQEVYNFYNTTGYLVSCPTCNATSGQIYNLSDLHINNYGVGAAGTPLFPLNLKVSEIKAGAINHLIRMLICFGCADRATNQWPAQTNDGATPNTAFWPYGTIIRLKSSYTWPGFDSLCTTTTCHTYVNTIIAALKAHGFIIDDVGSAGHYTVAIDSPITPDIFVGNNNTGALAEIDNNLAINSTNFEVVNVTSLQTDGKGNAGTSATAGEVYYNNGTVTPVNYVIVKVTDSASATAQMSVSLQGLTIGVPRTAEVFQAGAPATQMVAWVNGVSNQAYTCSLSPSGGANGTVTSGCLYTPPASVSGKTITTLTFTAAADGVSTATQSIVIFPGGIGTPLRINVGQDVTDYTDGSSNLWYADQKTGDPALFGDNSNYNFGALAWTGGNAATAPTIYNKVSGSNDIYHFLHVPNGLYSVTAYYGATETAPGQRQMSIDAQGVTVVPRFDFFTQAGAADGTFSYTFPVSVNNGTLLLVARDVGVNPTTNGCCNGTLYSPGNGSSMAAFSLTQTSSGIGTVASGAISSTTAVH